ncbi:uncharacterized protein LY89DRAFT_361958 [Mollisia scopiformis]|uniref:HD domain-containing protein n=1 Tax=Mollisia scopiformis TaxID=149040 RepID=A0A132B5Y9_MOLSC|nr:uncharacterized protein LY89DRAFT_361958 [Mollisia scopiformis]KUJ07304.1 hypothetical protein LY89DRAFT_361958 [Mollisia scopiformis]
MEWPDFPNFLSSNIHPSQSRRPILLPVAMDQISSSCIPFIHVMEGLKYKTPTCWEYLSIPSFESAADHMWQTWAVLLAYAQIRLWTELKKESLAKDYLRCLLQTANATLAREFDHLWSEYKQGESQVAKRVRDACACAYAVQDGSPNGTIRTGEELSQLRKSVLSLDLENFMDLLLDEIKAPDQTESATLMKAMTVGQAYWNTPSESFELVSEAMETIPSTSPLTFLRLTQRLAKIGRAGWVRRGISSTKVEKVSGHSWRMAILGWLLVPQVSLTEFRMMSSLIIF